MSIKGSSCIYDVLAMDEHLADSSVDASCLKADFRNRQSVSLGPLTFADTACLVCVRVRVFVCAGRTCRRPVGAFPTASDRMRFLRSNGYASAAYAHADTQDELERCARESPGVGEPGLDPANEQQGRAGSHRAPSIVRSARL